jgi:hypothetical protein
MDHGVEAAVRLARISRELLGLPDEQATLRGIAAQAVNAVDACEDAVVSESRGKRLLSSASTSGIAEECDVLQHRRREGPSVEVLWKTEVCLVEDTVVDTRWPVWGRRVSELGMSSVLAVHLAAGSRMPGSLTFYSSKPDAFDAAAIAVAFSYTTHAAVALFTARAATGFAQAVETRHMIGVAQGVLMARYGLDLDSAFELLRRHSNSTNTKLRDVARQVADDGGLPRDAIPPQYLPVAQQDRVRRGPDSSVQSAPAPAP